MPRFLRLSLLLLLLAPGVPTFAQDFIQNYIFVKTGTNGPGISFANTGVSSFFMSWSPQTSMNTCSIQADSSSDGSSWGSGDLIASQSCTTVGSATIATLGNGKNFVRINVTAMSGNGGLNVTLKGWGGGASTGGGITWLTVATLPGSPALNTTDGVTDGNGFSCTVGGGSTRVLCRWNGASWDVVNGDPTAAAAVTGAVKTATNGADASFFVPGLNPSPDVSTSPYPIRCDSATQTLDRAQTVRFVAGASVATMPDIGTAGCTAGFVTSLIAGVTITVNRTTSSTFDIYNGTNPPLTGQTTFSLPAGQHATISPSASGTSWIVRFASAVTGASVTSTTPVTVTNPTINTDTQMIELALPAGFLNKAGMGYTIRAGGLYSNTVATSPALTFNAKLCTVSGCGSGTVVGLAQIVSGATSATATTNDTWTYSLFAVNNATGATGNLLVKGDPGLTIDLSNVGAAADTIYSDVNTAVSGNIDLTAALFLDFTVAQSVAGASNSYKQLSAMIAPHASPAGASSGGGVASIITAGMSWYWGTLNEPGSTSTLAVGGANEVRACGFVLPFTAKITTIAYNIGAQGTGNFDIGLYDSTKTLVVDIGATAVQTVGTHTATPTTTTLQPGYYYTAFTFSSSATNTISGTAGGTLLEAVGTATCGTASNAATAGALPATLGTITGNNNVNYLLVKAFP